MNPQPVYNSFEVERIVEFKTIFPRSALPKISECFRGYDKEHMLGGLLANLANKVVGKPFYNPNYRGNEADIDALRFFLSGKNVDLINQSINNLYKAARYERIPVENYMGATEETVLYLLREIMSVNCSVGDLVIEETEKKIFKAYLAANSLTIEKGFGKNPYNTIDSELYLAASFVSQLGSADFLYQDKKLLMMSQTIKCLLFFEYAERDSLLRPLIQRFCDLYGIKEWWMYPKAFWSVFALTDGKASIINFRNPAIDEVSQYASVIDKSSITVTKVIPKKENEDYTAFRTCPLIKVSDYDYLVLNFQLLIERIYSGLYFDFRMLAEEEGIKQSDFKRHFSTEFSEHSLFCGTLREALTNHFGVLMSEDDCLNADSSKDALSASPPDFYARQGNVVMLFENKDMLMSKELKEKGSIQDYIVFLRTRLYENDKGSPKGVRQLMNHVKKIRNGEFQRRWDSECPRDAMVYPVIVVPEVKFTLQGVKNFLQRWQLETGIPMENVKPIAYTDIGTLCLYQFEFANKGIQSFLDEYYTQSDYTILEKSKNFNDIPNAMMSFTDYLTHTYNETLNRFADKWEEYIRKPLSESAIYEDS